MIVHKSQTYLVAQINVFVQDEVVDNRNNRLRESQNSGNLHTDEESPILRSNNQNTRGSVNKGQIRGYICKGLQEFIWGMLMNKMMFQVGVLMHMIATNQHQPSKHKSHCLSAGVAANLYPPTYNYPRCSIQASGIKILTPRIVFRYLWIWFLRIFFQGERQTYKWSERCNCDKQA